VADRDRLGHPLPNLLVSLISISS
jgi:hypothetical protein